MILRKTVTREEAGLRLDDLKADFADPRTAEVWTKVHDKMAQGKMPPPKRPRPSQAELAQTTQGLYGQLHAASLARQWCPRETPVPKARPE